MDISLLVFIIAVVFFGYRGYRRGLGASLSRIFGLLAGYACAILFTPSLAALLEARTGLQGLVTYAVAGMILFFGGTLLVSLVFSLFGRLLRSGEGQSLASSVGGGITGALVGAVVGLALVWGISFIRELQPAAVASQQVPVVAAPPSAIERVARQAAGGAVAVAVDAVSDTPEVARATKALLESPAETTGQMQRLMRSEELRQFLNDSRSQALMNAGDAVALTRQAGFQQLYQNPDLQGLIKAGGLPADNPEQLAAHFSRLWRRAQQVKDDPQLQAILQDPEFQEQIKSGNPATLWTNPKVQQIAEIVYAAGSADLPPPVAAPAPVQPGPPVEIHRWVDSEGRVHFSDEPPPQ
ncbi:CvpA family protein [Exilibacterium tricleocarpae]|uniref:CvpA family protein n=1 Tax=Exilibacterium tricleocarpae TaxID=2591008 RepID=UPI0015D3E780|nr:CvpA family protein [Exilibacterium tricleocarpae]